MHPVINLLDDNQGLRRH